MKKRLSGILLLILIIGITLEFSPYLMAPVLLDHAFSRKEYRQQLKSEWQSLQAEQSDNKNEDQYRKGLHVIHPYLGFVHRPGNAYNELGFLGPNPMESASEDVLNVCLTGGSVAKLVFELKGEYLSEKLQQLASANNKIIRLYSLALGGFKQPQQLIAINYLLSLNAHFDMVINLDGFNEVVLPYSDNMQAKIHPSFPRNWNIISRKSLDFEQQILLAEQAMAREEKKEVLSAFISSPLKYSNLALLFWKVIDNNKNKQIISADEKLRKALRDKNTDYQLTGPDFPYADTNEYFENEVSIWGNASRQLNKLSQAKEFDYFHFLQPNQYVPGSKKLTRRELEIAYIKGPSKYKDGVQKGYPVLRKMGTELIREGIPFADLSMMFKNTEASVYNDQCCHFNEYGYEMIIDTMVSYIESYYLSRKIKDEKNEML